MTHEQKLQQAQTLARDLFIKNPGLSIHEAARMLEARCDRSLVKPVIASIRREVRLAPSLHDRTVPNESDIIHLDVHIGSEIGGVGDAMVPAPDNKETRTSSPEEKKGDPSSPRLGAIPPDIRQQGTDAVVEQPSWRSNTWSSPAERRQAALDWAKQHPKATMNEAREMLMQRFNKAIGNADLAKTLREAKGGSPENSNRRISSVSVAPVILQESKEEYRRISVDEIVQAMKMLNVGTIELKPDGSYSVRPLTKP